jgi:ribose transport system permease protein
MNSFQPDQSSSTSDEVLVSQEAPEQPGSDGLVAQPAATSTEPRAILPPMLSQRLHALIGQEYSGVLLAIVVLVVIIGVAHPGFLRFDQLSDTLAQSSYVVLLACGMTFLLAMGELDLSVGGIYGLTAIFSAMLIQGGLPTWLAVVSGLALGAVLGFCNALIIQFIRLPAFVATLATASIYRGLAEALSNGMQILGPATSDPFSVFMGSRFLGIAAYAWVTIIVIIFLALLLNLTPFGFRVRSIGSNRDAALFSGLPVNRIRMLGFMLSGLMGAVAGMLALGYLGSADPTYGTGYELLAIAAAVIGGTALSGGTGSIAGAMLGAILLNIVSSALAYFSVPIAWDAFATGAVILLAVSLDSLLRRSRQRQRASL